jgi:hypothetical protein
MQQQPVPWYRVPTVWLLIALPLSAVLGGITTLVLAVNSDDGLVVDDYYRRGKEINRVLARDRAAADLGLSAHLVVDPQTGLVRVNVGARQGVVLPAEIELKLLHATRAGFDQTVMIARTPGGAYHAGVHALAPGHWYLELSTSDWRLVGSLVAPRDAGADLRPGVNGAGAS